MKDKNTLHLQSKESLDGKPIEYMEIAIHKIRPSRFQTRRLHDPIQEAALRESVREHGVLEPLVVRAYPKDAGLFEIVCGHMRRKAALEAGLDMIPCMVVAIPDEAAFELAMVENVARSSLNPIDEAFGYKRLLAEGIAEHQRGLARRLGVSESRISQLMMIADLPEPLIREIRRLQEESFTRVKPGQDAFRITERHLRSLRGVDLEGQLAVVRAIFGQELSAIQSEKLAHQFRESASKSTRKREKKMSVFSTVPPGTCISMSSKQIVIRIAHEKAIDTLFERFQEVGDWIHQDDVLNAFFPGKEDAEALPG